VPPGWRVAVSAVEHASILNGLPLLAARGHRVDILPVDGDGVIGLDGLERVLKAGPTFVSVMSANNETGTIQPVGTIGALCRAHGALFHVDAVQSLSTRTLDVEALGIDLLSLSGHKLYGPQGIGALYLRDGLTLAPLLVGGGQQQGRRSGTIPVALAVGLGEACRIARAERDRDAARLLPLRERLCDRLRAAFPALIRNGPAGNSLPGCLNVTLPGMDAADLLLGLPDLALATGSACDSREARPSPVLRAMGRSAEDCHAAFRFGLGRGTTAAEIDRAAEMLAAAAGIPM
jgi:cysteine desulfurase